MVVKMFLLLHMCFLPVGLTESVIDSEINSKKQIIQVLTIEIEEAKEKGTAETMDIVEKIGYVRKLEEELIKLEDQKSALEASQ